MAAAEGIASCRRALDRLTVWGNRPTVLTARRVLWIVTGGFWLAVAYLICAVGMLATIVFAPYALQVRRVALFALDGGITMEPFFPALSAQTQAPVYGNPAHPYTVAANVAWALLFGWPMVLLHMAAAVVQALSIVGLGTAITNVKLASYVIWPFGRQLRPKPLPITLEELEEQRSRAALDESTARALSWV